MKIYGNPPAIQKPFISEPGFWMEFPGGIAGGTVVGDASKLDTYYSGGAAFNTVIGIGYAGGVGAAFTWERVLSSRVTARRFFVCVSWTGSASSGPGAIPGFADSSGFVLSFCPRVEAAKSALRGLEINLLGEVLYLSPAPQIQIGTLFITLRPGAGNSSYAWGRATSTFIPITQGNFAGDYSAGLTFDRLRFQMADSGGLSSPLISWRALFGQGANRNGGQFAYAT